MQHRPFALSIICILLILTILTELSCFASRAAAEDGAVVFALPVTSESVADWKNPDPESLEITFVAGVGGDKDAVRFRILKPIPKRLEVRGPSFDIPACDPAVVRRAAPLAVRAKLLNMADASAAVSLLNASGRPLPSVAGNRDFQTALVMNGSGDVGWRTFSQNAGCILPGCNAHKVQLMLDFSAKDAPCEFLIESLVFRQTVRVEHKIQSSEAGNVFFSESGQLRVFWAKPEFLKEGTVTLSDENRETLQSISVAAGTKETIVPLNERGFYDVSAIARYEDGSTLQTRTSAAVVGPAVPESIREQSRFGLMRCHMSEDFAVKLGSRWDSGWYNFYAIEQNPDGTLRSNFSERESKSADKAAPNPPVRRLKQIFSSSGNYPLWLRRPNVPTQGLYPPNDWEKLGECVELWTKTNPSLPDVLGPYHEVDAAWKTNEDEMVLFHNVVSSAYKRARPDVPVAGPVFCNLNVPSFKRLVKKGILKNNDVVNIHPYVNGSAPEEEFISEIIEMQDYLRDEGLGKLPVYFTEFGWTSSENDWQKAVDSRTRARYCARSLILCTARDIKALVYFAGRFQEPEDVEHYWMVRSNYTPYPTLSAYATAARELSDIPNGGAFFRLAPDAFLCSFLRCGKTLWVLWTSDDVERRVTLPETPISVRSMTGKKLTPSAGVTLTPSPLYVEFEDPKLAVPIENAETGKTVETFPGSEIPLSGTPVLNIVQTENGSARFSDNAPVGNYTILSRTEDGCLMTRRVVVTEPFEIAWKDFVWDGKSETMTLRFSFRNHTNAISSGSTRIGTESSAAPVPFEVPARQERVVSLPLSVQTGVRQTNCVTFEIQAPIHRTRKIPFDVTPTAIPYYSNAESNEKREPENSADFKADWSAIPAIPVAQWGRPGDVRERDKAEIPAEIQAYATQAGIHLRITVHDQQHVQKYGSWSFMNAEDSIKLGFDLDAGKPWEFNNIRFGYNGHRCVEYAFSQTTPDPKTGKRQNQWWTTRSWLETIKSGPAFHLTPQTNIVRDETRNTTMYEILIRWKDLEATEPLEEGTVLGFSLVIYDKNPETSRKMLRFGLGPDGGSPLDYGRITLVKP